MLEMYYDGTGHYYRNSPRDKWIRMDGDEDTSVNDAVIDSSELIELQERWGDKYGAFYSRGTILEMLEDAEEIIIKSTFGIDDGECVACTCVDKESM